jgi:hypothetical protein
MATQLQEADQRQVGAVDSGHTQTVPSKETDFVPLKEVVEAIRRDSRDDADGYLDEARVPFGGE